MTLGEAFTSALRYWEPRRLIYNVALSLVVIACFVVGYPTSKRVLNLDGLLIFFVLAVLANIAYCAAYIPDVLIQNSSFRDSWMRWRWLLLALGIAFGAALAYLLASGPMGVRVAAHRNW